MSKPTIFLTGATGNIGGGSFENIDKSKVNVKVGVRDVSKADKFKKAGAEVVQIDLGKKETLTNAFKNVDRLLVVPPNSDNRAQEAMNAIEAGIEVGVKHIVMFSVPDVQQKRIAFHKEWAPLEEKLKSSGVDFTIVAAPFFQEMYLGFKDEVRLPYGDGAAPSASVFDLGRTIATILQDPQPHVKKSYTLTGPEMLTGNDIAKALSEALGKDIKYKAISESEAVEMYMSMGFKKWQAEGVAELLQEYTHRRVQLTNSIELTQAQSITGKAPRTFKETAKQALAQK